MCSFSVGLMDLNRSLRKHFCLKVRFGFDKGSESFVSIFF
ncbi:hypothetical protein LEP1GSC021_2433 [Leptospira noguchii str. 1993005606]|uniref:Uncharacterized protein n=1 Tax=Leptospira noguchii str. 2007001578 TaxID=1049974 RepID=A0ABP2T1R4_9LEPT|nr:hypothetical protein LEP1GSC035_0433 [Leptospira noguchii str. 2007001578]EPE83022.1 hypothetical protein LEP1GSC021_2433 [Leptospira noguchii str. 1993005606]